MVEERVRERNRSHSASGGGGGGSGGGERSVGFSCILLIFPKVRVVGVRQSPRSGVRELRQERVCVSFDDGIVFSLLLALSRGKRPTRTRSYTRPPPAPLPLTRSVLPRSHARAQIIPLPLSLTSTF